MSARKKSPVRSKPTEKAARRRPGAPGGRRVSGGAEATTGPAAAAVVEQLKEAGFTRAKIGGFDVDGVLRGKYVSLDKLESALSKGFGFCDVIFGWDISDAVYDNGALTGPHTGYPDARAVLDPSTARAIPWEPGVVALLCDFRTEDGEPHPGCPRSLLKRVIEQARAMGFEAKLAAEYEFFFFQETRESIVEKGFRGLQPLDPGMFGYSWVRSGQDCELMRDVFESLEQFEVEIEGLHTETGPGVYEAAIRYDDALRAADKAALFKSALKQIAHRHGLSVTFMAKWDAALPGCSGHLHQSLWRNGKNAFHDPRSPRGMSTTLRRYIAGQVGLMRELTALYSPVINSYKRYVPGLWAPLVASWGVENRNCAVRVIGLGDPSATRIEYRQTAADMNPYVAMAASLAAGLWGIETKAELPPEAKGEPGVEGPGRLPTTLEEAIRCLDESRVARALLGSDFIDHYVRTREWEIRTFHRAVTDWELRRYFETV